MERRELHTETLRMNWGNERLNVYINVYQKRLFTTLKFNLYSLPKFNTRKNSKT